MIIAAERSGGQNSAYRHLNMKGAFGDESALRFLRRQSRPQRFGAAAREDGNAKPLFP